ncbi:MarR family transcriptional regulator [Gordonia sp. Z-3]|uniref:MarR family transcriptional regulator n=1 Tax=Gordonia aquimaris TaxID=2984863 RepID=A0A9X3I3Y8_9ACTN|nr:MULTISPECIES: MarR family transcriptional regulator [Gordonia]MAU80614.1 MarR family transcriptional regulator [Gordonia sp. (in: high G+C Gram-positive bacteria)]MCX2962924.1 MarR family transcriptional regulator [Gordonia aquimaris]MED5801969.1 MarR family transcriptional regulator [Gordonia sp. Z-3]
MSEVNIAGAEANPLLLERQVCFALAVANRSVLKIYRRLLEPLGLTHPQYLVMLALWEDSPRAVKDLGQVLQLDSATLSPLLKRLESSGLVLRQRRGDDERNVDVALTDDGRALREQALDIPPAVIDALGVDLDVLEELHGVLTRVNAAATRAEGMAARG